MYTYTYIVYVYMYMYMKKSAIMIYQPPWECVRIRPNKNTLTININSSRSARRPADPHAEKRFPSEENFFLEGAHQTPKNQISGMTADSDRHLARFELFPVGLVHGDRS